jgi:hypothetical protein
VRLTAALLLREAALAVGVKQRLVRQRPALAVADVLLRRLGALGKRGDEVAIGSTAGLQCGSVERLGRTAPRQLDVRRRGLRPAHAVPGSHASVRTNACTPQARTTAR